MIRNTAIIIACTLLFTGCAALQPVKRQGVASSLVDYLYPEGEIPSDLIDARPVLNLPLRIGLAFVPSNKAGSSNEISDKQKSELLEKVRIQFEQYAFIEQIVVIPDNYLSHGKGFTTVEQVARLYGVDVVALVSYDQVIFSRQNAGAFLYLTIVGAYTVPGDEQRIDTFVDTAVFDVRTRKLLFRAPGVDTRKDVSRLLTVEAERVRISQESMAGAVAHMSANLDAELHKFKERVKSGQAAEVRIRSGYSGGGAADGFLLMPLALIAALRSRRRKN
jgi:rhombotail lipoprotein